VQLLNTLYTIYMAVVQVNRPDCRSHANLSISQIQYFKRKFGRRQNVTLCSSSRFAAPLRISMCSKHVFKCSQTYHILFLNETGCPQRRVVVLRRAAGDVADFQSVTLSNVPARGIQECSGSSIDCNDSHVSGPVGCAPLLPCYDFTGLAHMQVIHGDGTLYINL